MVGIGNPSSLPKLKCVTKYQRDVFYASASCMVHMGPFVALNFQADASYSDDFIRDGDWPLTTDNRPLTRLFKFQNGEW